MRAKLYKTNKERGASIFLGLFAVLIIAGYILVNINVDKDRIVQERVTQAAWLIKQVSEAARLYVRDQNVAGNPLFQKTALCTTPRTITAFELINAGYIGANVGAKNTDPSVPNIASVYNTPLGQTIRIIAANSTINSANCTASQLGNVASTAYIVLQPPTEGIDNLTLASLAEALTLQGMPVGNPIFDGAGNNISDNCGIGPATIQWDTGCLDNAQFAFLTGGTGFGDSFMGVPTWLTFRGDNRAVFRYEQAENPAATKMQTDLMMATMDNDNDIDVCDQRQFTVSDELLINAQPTATRQADSGVCNDTGNRQNITNIGNIDTNRAINNNFIATGTTTIAGNVRAFNAGNAIQMGDVNFTGGSSSVVINRRNTTDTYAPRVEIANVNANLVQASQGSANNSFATGETSVLGSMNVNVGGITVSDPSNAGRGVLANTIGGIAGVMSVDNNATFSGNTSVAGQSTLAGGGVLPVAAGRINAGSVSMNGDLTTGGTLSVIGTTDTNITSVGTCVGDCPDRTPAPGSPL